MDFDQHHLRVDLAFSAKQVRVRTASKQGLVQGGGIKCVC